MLSINNTTDKHNSQLNSFLIFHGNIFTVCIGTNRSEQNSVDLEKMLQNVSTHISCFFRHSFDSHMFLVEKYENSY